MYWFWRGSEETPSMSTPAWITTAGIGLLAAVVAFCAVAANGSAKMTEIIAKPCLIKSSGHAPLDSARSAFLNNGFGFNFHQHLRRDEFAHLHHAGRGADRAKEFSMGTANVLPIANVNDVHAGADNIFQAGAGFRQRRFNVL